MQRAISNLRWEKAQVYERDFWSKQVSPEAGEASRFRWYEDRAHRIMGQVTGFLGRHREISVLEIGPGPVGIINYIEADERHALDPLEDYYGSQAEFVHVRDRGVTRHNGTGEDILSLNKTFSLIILDNVLDHMKDPGCVLRGIHKSLDPGGVMFISLNIYTRFGAMVRNAMECLEIDKGHPFNFSQSRVLSLLQKSRFKVTWSQTEDYGVQKRKYRESRQLKKVFKSCLGVVDFRFTAFCRKV
jgi:SAM-dependent methyltransferase